VLVPTHDRPGTPPFQHRPPNFPVSFAWQRPM
jgi:hypothetical protein